MKSNTKRIFILAISFVISSLLTFTSCTVTMDGVVGAKTNESGSAFIITNYHVVYDSACNTDDGISNNIDICLSPIKL